jgi:lipoprotein-anchoring transpeptidase ErfK/SrfK
MCCALSDGAGIQAESVRQNGRGRKSLGMEARMKRIEVSLSDQVLTAFDGSAVSHTFDCVTGDDEHPTTPGNWTIHRKHKTYRSKKYNAQMDFAMFYYNGEAIHQYHGPVPISVLKFMKKNISGWLGSHGCVRLSHEDAETLFGWAPMKTPVVIA